MPSLVVESLRKSFTLHLQGGTTIPVLDGLSFAVDPGECVLLAGASGVGKSTVLKLIYGTYRAAGGSIRLRHDDELIELVNASPRHVLEVRRRTWAMSASSCASCRACPLSTLWPSRC